MEFFKLVDIRTSEKKSRKNSGLKIWKITTGYPPARDKAVIHLTINRERKQKEFMDDIHHFLGDLKTGLTSFLS